jgi:predicted dehydrogenase
MIADVPGYTASIEIVGTDATLHVDNPIAPQDGASLQIRTDGNIIDIPVLPGSTYEFQLTAFRDAIAFDAPFSTTTADGVATMALIDACYVAAGLDIRPTLE